MNTLAHLLTSITSSDLIEYRIYYLPDVDVSKFSTVEAECFTTIAASEQDALDALFCQHFNATILDISTD